MSRLLPPESARRSAAFTAAALIAAAFVVTTVLPRRTPAGILFLGALDGCANAMLATGIVLVYRSARVVNFAQAGLGAAGAYFMFVLCGLFHWPLALGLGLGVLAGAAMGVFMDAVFVQRFFTAPRLVLTVVTVVAADLLSGTRQWVDRIPGVLRAQTALFNQDVVTTGKIPMPFKHWTFTVSPLPFGFGAVLSLALVAAALAGLAVFLRRSRVGVAIRGAAENADRALLLGINVRLLSTLVWMMAGVLSFLAAVVTGLNRGFAGVGSPSPETLVPALAAAVLARMTSIPVAVVAAIGISAFEQAVFWSYPRSTTVPLALLGVIAAGLIVQRRRTTRGDDAPASSWEATKEMRPTPRAVLAVDGVRRARRVIVAAAVLGSLILPVVVPTATVNLAGLIAIYGIIALSLVVLTGWAGQVSLGQFGVVAVAAAVGGSLTSKVHVSFWLAVPLTAIIAGAFAALVGLPALRLKGSFLAVTTLAFAVAVQQTLFGASWLHWLIPDRVDRPNFFFVSFADERNYYYLCVASLLACAVAVRRLRTSRPGRVLIALRDNEHGVEAFGVNLLRMRLAAFALAGALCGVAGVLYVHHQRALDAGSYEAARSVQMFVMVMIGGVTSVSGALLGAAYVGVTSFLLTEPIFRQLTTGGALLVLLIVAPGGLAQLVYGLRDSALRIVAIRLQIVVPSLFEDADPVALFKRKVPLASRSPGNGLDTIPPDRRYALESDLYGRDATTAVPA